MNGRYVWTGDQVRGNVLGVRAWVRIAQVVGLRVKLCVSIFAALRCSVAVVVRARHDARSPIRRSAMAECKAAHNHGQLPTYL